MTRTGPILIFVMLTLGAGCDGVGPADRGKIRAPEASGLPDPVRSQREVTEQAKNVSRVSQESDEAPRKAEDKLAQAIDARPLAG